MSNPQPRRRRIGRWSRLIVLVLGTALLSLIGSALGYGFAAPLQSAGMAPAQPTAPAAPPAAPAAPAVALAPPTAAPARPLVVLAAGPTATIVAAPAPAPKPAVVPARLPRTGGAAPETGLLWLGLALVLVGAAMTIWRRAL